MSFTARRPAPSATPPSDLPRRRADRPLPSLDDRPGGVAAAWVALACGFVLLGGGSLDLGPAAARLGMAASEGTGPLGQVVGGWDPALWPGRVMTAQAWAWGEGGRASAAAVRWPEAIAVLGIGLILSRRLAATMGRRAGLLLALSFFGSVAAIHRAEGSGVDWIAGLAVVAALDRILTRGSDLGAGVAVALAVLAGGWPPAVMIALALVVPGRPLTLRLVAPGLALFAAWSFWAVRTASPEAWGAAIALPLTKGPAWWLIPGALALALPWAPAAALATLPSVRSGWSEPARGLILGWLQAAGAAALAGTLVPGLAPSARVVILGGLAMAAAAAMESILFRDAGPRSARTWLGVTLGVTLVAALGIVPLGGYLAAAVPYYRQVALLLCGLGLAGPAIALAAAGAGRPRLALAALALLAVTIKLTHYCVYVPEWNYRMSQGPWGRAIGQWVPPNWPLYVVHAWPDDLLFHTDRPVRQLAAPEVLGFKPKDRPHFVLLLDAEFTHWPKDAPPLVRVREFLDDRGAARVLARTEGELKLR